MTIATTDTDTLKDWLEILTYARDHRSNNLQSLQSIRIKIKAIEITLADREGAA